MKKNLIALSLGLPLCLLSFSSFASTKTENVDAVVTVQNSFTLQINQTLDFGIVRAVAGLVTPATLSVPANPNLQISTTPGSGSDPAILDILDSSSAQPAQLAIAEATKYTPLTIELPDVTNNPVELATDGPGTTPVFEITAFTLYATVGQNANQDIAITNNQGTITTDGSGNAEFNLGATLSTEVISAEYVDGEYKGTVAVTVSY